jgi:hypothetical protein
MGLFTPETMKKLRAALKPRRERYDLAFVMERWAALVKEHWAELAEEVEELERGGVKASSAELIKRHWAAIKKRAALVEDAKPDHGRVTADQFVWCGSDDPVAPLVGEPQRRRQPLKRPKRGRHSADRYAALLLAVISHEYTGDPPTRNGMHEKKWRHLHFMCPPQSPSRRSGSPRPGVRSTTSANVGTAPAIFTSAQWRSSCSVGSNRRKASGYLALDEKSRHLLLM